MKHGNRWMMKILVLVLVLNIFMVGFAVPLPTASVTAQTTTDPGLDQYGGWKGLQGHNTTGHWTVELIGDRYWFVTPENNVLWDLTCLHMDPGKELQYSPALQYAPTYLSNLAKYGVDLSAWPAAVAADMASLGFNTRDGELANPLPIPGMNIMEHLDQGYNEAWNADEMNVPLLEGEAVRKFPDVFDPRFQLLWQRTCQQYLTPLKGNSHVIAVNLGGEQQWHGGYNCEHKTPDMFIAAPRSYVCKQWWVNTFLKGRYSSVQALNTAYGTSFGSWDELLDCTSIPDNANHPAIVADKLDYTEAIANQYYSVMTTEVEKILPNVLLFSERWQGDWLNTTATMPYNERIWKEVGKYCDVVCLQEYSSLQTQEEKFQAISRYVLSSGKPLMISEGGFYANDTSERNSPGYDSSHAVSTQMDRAKKYVQYMNFAYNYTVTGMNSSQKPLHVIMGRHWYKWYDDPPFGSVSGEYFNWGIFDNQDEAYIPFADVMATVNKQSYTVATGQHPLIVPDPPTPVTPAANTTVGDLATFTWKAIPNARSYTLLLSPERAFPDAQTIRIDGIQGTSHMLTSPLAQGNWWWTVCAVENTYGYSGLYPDATNFRVKNETSTLAATLDLEQLNRVTFEDIWDTGGSASSYAFLDTTQKDEGASSVRCVFTQWAWNKTGNIGRNNASVFVDCSGTAKPWTGITLAIRPTNFCDTTGNLVPSSKYLRVRVWDKSGRLFLDQPLDPQGILPTGEWSTITVPFGMYGSQDVSAIALTLVTGQDKIACDQRLTINVDNIVPLTNQNIMILQVGKAMFTVNGASKTLDSPPVIKNGRTLVPIRAIIEALGGTVGWDGTARKAMVTLGKKTIALWIGKSVATVNGVSTLIDSTNAKVVPEIINGRTMLPLRFVTESLGATVAWEQSTQTITITYAP